MLRVVSVVFAAAVVLASAAGAAGGRSAAQGTWILFSGDPASQSIEQIYRIHPAGDGIQQLTTGTYSSVAPAFSHERQAHRLRAHRRRHSHHERRRNGPPSLDDERPRQLPRVVPDGTHIAFIRPFKTEWRVNTMTSAGAAERRLAKAPPSGRPSWTAAGLLIPSGGDLLKVDPTTGRVLKYYGAEIDAIWGLNSVTLSPSRSLITYVGARAAEPGDKECGEGPCQRFALYKEKIAPKVGKPQKVTDDAGPGGFSPNGSQLAFVDHGGLELLPLAGGSSTTIPTGDVTPTVSAPPAWR